MFDGKCGFCKIWIDYAKLLTGETIEYAPSQERGSDFPRIPAEEFSRSVQLVLPGGAVRSGAHAAFTALSVSGRVWPLRLYEKLPGFGPVSEAAYRWIAAHRDFGYRATVILFGKTVQPSQYALTAWLFLRLLGLVYLLAFLSLGWQVMGLAGANGILPASHYLDAVLSALGASAYWKVPTVFWLGSSDAMLLGAAYLGAAGSLAALCGVSSRVLLAALYILYLSLMNVGQDFLSFQWDSLLLEAGFLAIFLSRAKVAIYLYRWLLFRLLFLSGAVKLLSKDVAWRQFAALDFHYFTQPLPTPIAWYLAQLPQWFSRASNAFVFFAELLVPFLIFAPRRLRHFGAGVITALQVLILLSGNYAFFNLLTLSLCVLLFDDRALARLPWIWRFTKAEANASKLLPRLTAVVAAVVLVISASQLAETFFGFTTWPTREIQAAAAPFEIVNTYGLFAVMTTTRIEIVVQGSNDGTTWRDYAFRYKPGGLRTGVGWVAPYQPRLDWQMWFAALGSYRNNPWFVSFMRSLLNGSPDVLALLRNSPFKTAPPKYVRALAYEYRFADWQSHQATGNWWIRTPRGYYLPPISLASFR